MDRLKGLPVAKAIKEDVKNRVAGYRQQGIVPTVAMVRIGERPDDVAYEQGATKTMTALDIAVLHRTLVADVAEETLLKLIDKLNEDDSVHGILIFMPLPAHISEDAVRHRLSPEKDIDGVTPDNMARLFMGKKGMVPCTPKAVMEVLDFYGMKLKGKEVLVMGRSLVVGKPLMLMLMERHATVTVAHSRTVDLPELSRRFDLVIAAIGKGHMIDETYVKEGAVWIDVGINPASDGGIIGDVKEAAVESIVCALTPVPGGVGSVTTAVLAKQLLDGMDGLYKA